MMKNKTLLISGVGIAGPTLAFWLKAGGYEPTLIERAPQLRAGGYVIDFWGLGYDIAERMGLKKDIERVGYHVKEMRIVDDRSKRVSGFDVDVFRELTNGRYVTLGRSELSYPEDWVNQLRSLNGGRKYMPSASGEPMAQAPTAPAQKPAAAAAAGEPVRVPALQVVEANPRT